MWKVKQWHYGKWAGWWYAYRHMISIGDVIALVYFNNKPNYESLSELTKLLKSKGEAYEMAD